MDRKTELRVKYLRKLTLLAAVVPMLLGVGCGSDDGESGSYQVAVVIPYTGNNVPRGQRYDAAIRMAAKHLDDAGYLDFLDRPFRLNYIDSGAGKEAVAEELQALINRYPNQVYGVITSGGAAHQGAAMIAAANEIPVIEASSGAHFTEFIDPDEVGPDITQYLLSTRALCKPEAEITADFIDRDYGGQTAVMFRGDKTHDKMHTEVIRGRLATMASDVVVADSTEADANGDFTLDYEDTDAFQSKIAQVITDHDPGVLFFHLRGDSVNSAFLKAAQDAGFTGDIVTCGMTRTMSLIDPAINGDQAMSEYLKDRLHFVMRSPLPSQSLDDFKVEFVNENPAIEPDTWTASVYDAMMLIGLGVAVADGEHGQAMVDAIVDVSRIGAKVGYGSLMDAVDMLRNGTDFDFDGASGVLDIKDDRSPVQGAYYVERVIEGGDAGYQYLELTDFGRVVHPAE